MTIYLLSKTVTIKGGLLSTNLIRNNQELKPKHRTAGAVGVTGLSKSFVTCIYKRTDGPSHIIKGLVLWQLVNTHISAPSRLDSGVTSCALNKPFTCE